MHATWFCILPCKQFEFPFENIRWRKVANVSNVHTAPEQYLNTSKKRQLRKFELFPHSGSGSPRRRSRSPSPDWWMRDEGVCFDFKEWLVGASTTLWAFFQPTILTGQGHISELLIHITRLVGLKRKSTLLQGRRGGLLAFITMFSRYEHNNFYPSIWHALNCSSSSSLCCVLASRLFNFLTCHELVTAERLS